MAGGGFRVQTHASAVTNAPPVFEAEGDLEYVVFTLADGSEIGVALNNDQDGIEVRNRGRRMASTLAIFPQASNALVVGVA